jgi:hypothetical protein
VGWVVDGDAVSARCRAHGHWDGLRVASVPRGLFRKPRLNPRLPEIRQRLYLHLQRTNYVRPSDLANGNGREAALQVLQEAGMVLYCEARGVWVPDVGTLGWVIGRRLETKRP